MVGSIGAKMTAWNFSGTLDQLDAEQLVYVSGSLKNMGDPFTPPTEKEREKSRALVNAAARYFMMDVAEQRNDQLKQPIETLATGEVWMGREALALGLVDEIGSLEVLLKDTDSQYILFKKKQSLSDQLLKGTSSALVDSLMAALGQLAWQ
jgi:protease-4